MRTTDMPERYHKAVIAHVMVQGASQAIAFCEQAFGAKELFRVAYPTGKILHAEIEIEGSTVMVVVTPKACFETP